MNVAGLMQENVNYFKKIGGFHVLLKHVSSSDCDITMMNLLIQAVYYTHYFHYLVDSTYQDFAKRIKRAVFIRFGSLTDDDLRLAKTKDIDLVLHNTSKLLLQVRDYE